MTDLNPPLPKTGEDAEPREPPEVEEALLGQLQRAADGGYDYSRTKGLCDRAAALIAIYRDIFAEITAKAIGRTGDVNDPERITGYVIPVGPIHRAAGKLGFQMFDGEHYMTEAATHLAALSAELEGAREVLEPFVSAWDEATAKYQQAGDAWTSEEARSHLSADDFRRAAALLPNPAPAGRGE